MTTGEAERATQEAETSTAIGGWFRRMGTLMALLRRDDYRRDLLSLWALGVRSIIGLPFLFGAVVMFAVMLYLVERFATTPHAAYEVVQAVFAFGCLAAGSGLYAGDRRNGTFELLWLSSGSESSLLRLKFSAVLFLVAALSIPATWGASFFVTGDLPVSTVMFYQVTNGLFILCLMAFIGTFLPQAWAAGLLGAAILAGLYMYGHGSVSILNVFSNPIKEAQAIPSPIRQNDDSLLFFNRFYLLVFSFILFRAASKRLRKTM